MALAGALEHAAGTIARLDAALASHPLRPAWAWRARLDAIGRQAAVDGKAIDPWHLAALIEGVRLRLDHTPVLIDRGMLFAAAHHAFELYRWFAVPDETQRAAIRLAGDHLETVGNAQSPLLGAALGVHAWLDQGGARAPLRAALALYWQQRQVTALPCPLLTGAAALGTDIPWARDGWIGHFLAALAGEAEDGLALLAPARAPLGLPRAARSPAGAAIRMPPPRSTSWPRPRSSLPPRSGKRSASRPTTPPGCSTGLSGSGLSSEVSQRAKRRLYGLKHLAPLREATAPPRRPMPGRRPGRPSAASLVADTSGAVADTGFPLVPSPPLSPLERQKFDFSDIDRLLDLTDQAIRRTQSVLDGFALPGAGRSNCGADP